MQTESFLKIPNEQLNNIETLDLSNNDLSNLENESFIRLCENLSQCNNLKRLNFGDNLAFLSINKFRMLRKTLSNFEDLKVS